MFAYWCLKRKYPIRVTLKFLATLLAGDCAASSVKLLTQVRGNLSEFLETNFNAHLLPALGVIRNLQRVVLPCVMSLKPLNLNRKTLNTHQKKKTKGKVQKRRKSYAEKLSPQPSTFHMCQVASGDNEDDNDSFQ